MLMVKGWWRWLLLFVFFADLQTAAAQAPELEFDHITMRDGLSMNPVMSILQDQYGYMWFGTQDGLNRYDGYSIKVYKTSEKDSLSLSENFITAMCRSRAGNLVVGTLSSGITIYHPAQNRFRRAGGYASPREKNILCLAMDPSGNVLAGTDEGVLLIDEKNGRVQSHARYPLPLAYLAQKRVLSLLFDARGRLWAGTTTGLYCLDKNKTGFYSTGAGSEHLLPHNIVTTLFEDSHRNIWVGTLSGLVKIDPRGRTGTPVYFKQQKQPAQKDPSSLQFYSIINNYSGNTIRTILEDGKGKLWVGTDMELVLYDPVRNSFTCYKKDLLNPKGINDHFIRSMFLDASGNLWVGTLGNGINKAPVRQKKFRLYQSQRDNPRSLSQNYVRAICEDDKGRVWVGTLVGGLNRMDVASGTFYHYGQLRPPLAPNDPNVWALCYDRFRNQLLLGTNQGLNIMDLSTGRFTYYTHRPHDLSSISENTVKCIFTDSRHRIWVGTEYGFNRFDPEKKIFVRYVRGNGVGLSSNTIWKIAESADGKLWLATSYGLNCFDPETEKFTSWQHTPGDSLSLSHNNLRTLLFDSDGELWIGTQNGLNRMDRKTGHFKIYREREGLPNAFIYSLEQDREGKIWMSTNRGLCALDKRTGNIRSYDVYDGLQDYEFNTNASFYSPAGEMYFAGPSGLNRFNPQQLTDEQFNPKVEITSLNVQNKPYPLDITGLEEIELPYASNMLEFGFSAFDYSNPSRNQYAYRLEGFNDSWVYCGHNRSATYTNLAPGQYVLHVRGTNADGRWSRYSDSIRLVITPPYYRTTWFYILALSLILLLLYGFYQLRIRHLRNEKRKLEQKVSERTREIQEQKEAIEAANRELEKLSIVARESHNAVIIANGEGIIEWINEGFVRMNGLDNRDRFYGKSLYQTSSNASIGSIIQKAVEEKQSVSYESVNARSANKKFYVQSTLTPIFNSEGQLTKIVVIDSDISERKMNEEIIRERNKSITDSINYALRIQSAILPGNAKMSELLGPSFVLFMPKDIVSGDFYLIESIRTNEGNPLSGFAVGDCTGHGVPGAFMSLIAQNYLRQSLHRREVNSTGEALDFLRDQINALFNAGSHNGKRVTDIIRDGLDIGFAAMDHARKNVYFAGAQHSLIVVRGNTLIEINGDMQPVGYHERKRPFTTHHVPIEPGDMLYLFSDGYMDQFGGPNGKKLKYGPFKNLLKQVAPLSPGEQRQYLHQVLLEWKGSFEQTDDICVLGVRV